MKQTPVYHRLLLPVISTWQNDSSILVSSSGIRLGTGSTIAAPSANEITLSTNSAERLRLTSGGSVAIGVNSPSDKLHVGGNNAFIRVDRPNGNPGLTLIYNSTNSTRADIDVTTGGDLRFATNDSTERLRIDSSGRLLLGLNSSIGGNAIFQVQGSGNKKVQFHQPDGGNCHIQFTNTTTGTSTNNGIEVGMGGDEQAQIWNYYNSYFRIGTNNAERLRITSAGTLESYSPDDTTPNIKWRSNDTNWYGSLNQSVEGGTITSFLSCGGDWSANGTTYSATKALAAYPTSAIAIHNQYNSSWGSQFVFLTKAGGSTTTDGAVTERLRITSDGETLLSNSTNRFLSFDRTNASSGSGEFNLNVESNSQATVSYDDGAQIVIGTSSSPRTQAGFTERMRIDASGYVTKPNTPAFFVYRNQAVWNLAAGDTFIFNTAELNVGNHYNTSNGRFTAPITARYVFHFWSIYTGDAQSDYVQMYKNGARMYGGDVHFTNSIGSQWDCVHYSRVIQLSASDYVYMRTGSAHTYHGNHWGGLSGYMLG